MAKEKINMDICEEIVDKKKIKNLNKELKNITKDKRKTETIIENKKDENKRLNDALLGMVNDKKPHKIPTIGQKGKPSDKLSIEIGKIENQLQDEMDLEENKKQQIKKAKNCFKEQKKQAKLDKKQAKLDKKRSKL